MGADVTVPAASGAEAALPALIALQREAFVGLAADCSNLAVTGFDAVYVEDCGEGVDPIHVWVKAGTTETTGRFELGAQTVFDPGAMGFHALEEFEVDGVPTGWTAVGAGALVTSGAFRSGGGGPVALVGPAGTFGFTPPATLVVWFVALRASSGTDVAELGGGDTSDPPDLDEGWTYVSTADVSTRYGTQLDDVRPGEPFITGPGRFRASMDRGTRTLEVSGGFSGYQSALGATQSSVSQPYVGLKGTQIAVERILVHPTALREAEPPVYDEPITPETGTGTGTGTGGTTSSGLSITDPGCQCGHTSGPTVGAAALAALWVGQRRARRLSRA
jgi:uncharacterized protein (TIGR03382 family)